MKLNTDLIYTGENFNAVFDTEENARLAFEISKSTLNAKGMTTEANEFEIDVANKKIYLTKGNVGNENDLVYIICTEIAKQIKNAVFYGHAFYDDDRCGYESCADYEYESGLLKVIVIESPEGNGVCPECEEQIVCFDEYDPAVEYECEECGAKVENHEDMFYGTLPIVKKYEEIIR